MTKNQNPEPTFVLVEAMPGWLNGDADSWKREARYVSDGDPHKNAPAAELCRRFGDAVERGKVMTGRDGVRYIGVEPTSFGSRVELTKPDGTVQRWMRGQDDGFHTVWMAEDEENRTWDELFTMGSVSLGWNE